MIRARSRSLVAAIAVSAVILYGLAGHGLPHMNGQEGMAAGLCLLLMTVLGYIAVPKPEVPRKAMVTAGPRARGRLPAPPPAEGRARASPVAPQRFRN